MPSDNYSLRQDQPLSHFRSQPTQLLLDMVDEPDIAIDVLVASGDCFVTLATQLDKFIHDELAVLGIEYPELETVISNLMYLQRHYHITKSPGA